jgi:hypothetical protein
VVAAAFGCRGRQSDVIDRPLTPPQAPLSSLASTAPIRRVANPTAIDSTATVIRLARSLGSESSFVRISALSLSADYLIVADRLTNPHITTISRATGGLGRYRAPHGQGRGQFYDPSCLAVISDVPLMVWVYDFTLHVLTRLQLDAPAADAAREEIPVRGTTMGCAFWTAGRIMGTDFSAGTHPLMEFDRNGAFLRHISVPASQDMPALRTGTAAVQPSGRRFAVSYRSAPRIDVFHASGVVDRIITAPPPKLAGTTAGGGPTWAYPSIAVTERFIYGVLEPVHRTDGSSGGRAVHVYSWDGTLVRTMELDHGVGAIVVDENDTELYGAYERSGNASPLIGVWPLRPTSTALAQSRSAPGSP